MSTEHKERVELHLHTKTSQDLSVITPKEMIETALRLGHKAVAVTDLNSVRSFLEAARLQRFHRNRIKVIYGAEIFRHEKGFTVLAKDKAGLKVLYKIISQKEITPDEREHILVGSSGSRGALFSAVKSNADEKTLHDIASKLDYIELFVSDEESTREYNRRLYELGKSLGIPVAAVGNCHYIESRDAVCKAVLDSKCNLPQEKTLTHFRTTEEMLEEFSYLGEDAAFEVVVMNTQTLSESIETIIPETESFPHFILPQASQTLKKLCHERLVSLYGESIPEAINERLCRELRLLESSGQDSLVLLAHKLTEHIKSIGEVSSSRGTVGSILTAYLLGISDVNPLPSHYRCKSCKHTEFADSAEGYDLPTKVCPHCQKPMESDGHNIPFETALDEEGEKILNMSIVTTSDACPKALSFLSDCLGGDNIAFAGLGTYYTLQKAQDAVALFEKEYGKRFYKAEAQRVSSKLFGTLLREHAHPAGVVILPQSAEWEDITPTDPVTPSVSGIGTKTHMDYFSIAHSLPKINILGYDLYEKTEKLFRLSQTPHESIDFKDPKVYKLFKDLDFQDIPEFSHRIFSDILKNAKEVNFSTLVKAHGMAHSTNAWRENAQELVKEHPLCELISSRDDVYLTLLENKVEKNTAYKIAQKVRKGKFSPESEENKALAEAMEAAGVPKWYIDSMSRIIYLFPKAHAVHYAKLTYTLAWFKVYRKDDFYKVITAES